MPSEAEQPPTAPWLQGAANAAVSRSITWWWSTSVAGQNRCQRF